ncbi:MAG TPA: hypothetical protein PK002_08475 [Cellvibrio sp.]|nr:hypothetical protein [Cellvibrio sp.]
MYGASVKDNKFGHNIVFMASELGKHSKILENLRLEPNPARKMLEENSLWGEYDVDSFLKSIEKFGDPSNRYNYYGSSYEASFLLKLDQVVHALRKNFIGDEPLHNMNKNDTLKHFAYDQNMCFAPSSYVHESMYGKFGLGISQSTLQVALNGMYGHSHVFEKWVTENMHFGKKETLKIKGK